MLSGSVSSSRALVRSLSLPSAAGANSSFIVTRGEGSYVFDAQNNKKLDFTASIAVHSLGHCHPKVVKAIQEQAARLMHSQIVCGLHQPALDYMAELQKWLPSSLDTIAFANSGGEAVENALKLAKVATGRPAIISMQGSFHGRTIATGAISNSKYGYRSGFYPAPSNTYTTPFPYCLHCPAHEASPSTCGPQKCCRRYAEPALDQLLKQQVPPNEVAAIIMEPFLGEGGYVIPPDDNFHAHVVATAKKIGALVIVDEVQTGFGRTGTMFAFEQCNFTPDILVMAKGIATGFPFAATVSRKEIMDKMVPGSVGGTYVGNAMGCAAAKAVLEVFRDENILGNVKARGDQLRMLLNNLKATSKIPVADIRLRGLWAGIEFKAPAGTVSRVVKRAHELGLLLLTTSIYETIRLMPPLIVSEKEMAQAIGILSQAVADCA